MNAVGGSRKNNLYSLNHEYNTLVRTILLISSFILKLDGYNRGQISLCEIKIAEFVYRTFIANRSHMLKLQRRSTEFHILLCKRGKALKADVSYLRGDRIIIE